MLQDLKLNDVDDDTLLVHQLPHLNGPHLGLKVEGVEFSTVCLPPEQAGRLYRWLRAFLLEVKPDELDRKE